MEALVCDFCERPFTDEQIKDSELITCRYGLVLVKIGQGVHQFSTHQHGDGDGTAEQENEEYGPESREVA
jgi:hypothetical protein